jgi:hypothetical protein
MKKLFFTSILIFSFVYSHAQEMLNKKVYKTAAVFGLQVKATQFDGEFAPVLNARAGWTLNQYLSGGFDFNLLIPTISKDGIFDVPVTPTSLFAGIYLEPIIWKDKLVHLILPVSAGYGTLIYLNDWNSDSEDNTQDDLKDGDFFRYLEPAMAAEINLFRRVRLNAGVSYRFTNRLNLEGTPDRAFNAFSYFVGAKFGL